MQTEGSVKEEVAEREVHARAGKVAGLADIAGQDVVAMSAVVMDGKVKRVSQCQRVVRKEVARIPYSEGLKIINSFSQFPATLEKGEFLRLYLYSFPGLRVSADIWPVFLHVEGAKSAYLHSVPACKGIGHLLK